MAYNKAEKPDGPMRKKGGVRRRKKVCVFCGKGNTIDYKDTDSLRGMFPRGVRFFPAVSPGTAQSIRGH